MEIVLKRGETLRVSFRDTEQLFEVAENDTHVIITQLSGWELSPQDDVWEESRVIFNAERC